MEAINQQHSETQHNLLSAQMRAINELCIVSRTDRQGIITFVNDQFCKISGYSRDELIGRPHSVINSGYHDRDFFKIMWSEIKAKRIWHDEICNQTKDGQFYWVDSTIVPSLNFEGEIDQFICIRYDITQRKIAENALIRSFKLASLGELSSSIAHEIKNPLCIISGKVKLMLNHLETNVVSPLRLKQDLMIIENTTQKMVKIVNGIGAMSREDDISGDFVEVYVGQIIQEALELCQHRFYRQGIQIQIIGDLNLRTFCHSTQITQVLLNLVCNAIDAIEELAVKWIKISVEEISDQILIKVADCGVGIPDAIREKMMNPFFTTKKKGVGTGLGLSISKKIIEFHNGSLGYDSSSENTCFEIRLPKKV